MLVGNENSDRKKTKADWVEMLKTEEQIDCMDERSFICLTALRLELRQKTDAPLAKLIKAYEELPATA